MVLFKQIRTRAYNFFLGRKLKQLRNKHETRSFSNSSSVALLFDGSCPENMEPVKHYFQLLRMENKKVHLLCYIRKERPGEALSFEYFTGQDLNWWFTPEKSRTEDFVNKQFDLLINLCTEECLPLEYLSALSRATYRVGRYIPGKTYCFDLMISMNGKKDVNYLIREVEHYLRMIR